MNGLNMKAIGLTYDLMKLDFTSRRISLKQHRSSESLKREIRKIIKQYHEKGWEFNKVSTFAHALELQFARKSEHVLPQGEHHEDED